MILAMKSGTGARIMFLQGCSALQSQEILLRADWSLQGSLADREAEFLT